MDENTHNEGRPPLIVGIGASAGGLQAFQAFFAHVPADSGMAFVLVQHLSPDHASLLAEILGRSTTIPVVTAEDGMTAEPNRVHVIPQDATLTIVNGRLVVQKPAPVRADRWPIDTFFLSLAKDQGDNAVSIVLSGVGSDGAEGLAAVKESGGLTIAQAEFDHHAMTGMPQSAAATGQVDFVMQVEDMPGKLIEYRDRLVQVADRKDDDGTRTDTTEHLDTVLSTLRIKTGHDFSKYKIKTVTRRIQRRMQVLQAATMGAYIKHLREDALEPELLFREILIGVTEFFRDAEAFSALKTAIEGLIDRYPALPSLRVWVPACSTGQEVYSLAITIREVMEARDATFEVQIFATDIDDKAIEVARAGRYQRTSAVSPDRLDRWFFEEDGAFRPTRKIRDMCVFSVHNVAKDPPFSRLDMISCRNLMIYLEGDLQDQLLRTFHYALKPGGLLFLGLSEGVGNQGALFKPQDKAAHLFRRQQGDAAVPIVPPPPPVPALPGQPLDRETGDRVDRGVRAALAKHSPVFIVVNRHNVILRYSGGEVARYLEPTAGIASLNLISNLRSDLRMAVRTVFHTVIKTERGAVVENVPFLVGGQPRLMTLIAEPVQDTAEAMYIVAFKDDRAVPQAVDAAMDASGQSPDTVAAEQLLRTVRAQLQATINELETANEEMKSSAEEYQSVNEELQSTNEELETSKEEMQSVNEELHTVNAEMMEKNDLLSILNSDLQNLLDSTQIATIFLNEDLRIKNFTPRMADIFSLRQSDRGRPLTDIVNLLAYDDLQRDVARVLQDLIVLERELTLQDGRTSFVMRIRPYRTIDRVIDGVVITFVDVTERKKAEQAKNVSERRFSAIVNQATVGVAETDLSGKFLLTNTTFDAMTGRTAQDLQGRSRADLISPDDAADMQARLNQAISNCQSFDTEYRMLRADGTAVWVHDNVSVLSDSHGHASSIISVTLDIDKRKRAEQQAALLLGELDHRVKNILAIVSSIVAQTLKANPSPEAFAKSITGRIAAVTRAHSLLTNRGAANMGTLNDLVETELEPYRGRDIRIDGPRIALTPKAGLSVAMAVHELASNAVKYGALSAPQGQLAVTWSVTGGTDRRLQLVWTETGGPAVSGPPKARGFGTTLIERSLAFEFDARISLTFPPSGVICAIDLPFTAEVGELRQVGVRIE